METYKIKQSRKDVTPAAYVVASALQNLGRPVYGLEISRAIQDITGKPPVCVQKAEGIWRLTTNTKGERALLLQSGITIREHSFSVLDTNPRLIDGKQTIRLNIGNVPYDVPDTEIKTALEILGIKFGSQLKYEFYKGEDEKPTVIKTGRRFISILPPSEPLPDMIKVADKHRAYLQYNRKSAHGTTSKVDHTGEQSEDLSGNPSWVWPPSGRQTSGIGLNRNHPDTQSDIHSPPTSSGWWQPGHVQDQLSDIEAREESDTLPTAPSLDWIPGPRKGFPSKPSTSDARVGLQANLNTLLVLGQDSNSVVQSQLAIDELAQSANGLSGGGFWSAGPSNLNSSLGIQQGIQVDNQSTKKLDLSKKNLDSFEEEQDILSQTSLKTLGEDIGIIVNEEEQEALSQTSLKTLGEDIGIINVPFHEANKELIPNIDQSDVDLVIQNDQPYVNEDSRSSITESNINVPQYSTSLGDVPLPSSGNDSYESYVIDPPQSLKLNSTIDMPLANSLPNIATQQKEVCLGGQPTIDNFTCNRSSRARTLSKEELLVSRPRSSSKRKGSPKDTPKSKKTNKSDKPNKKKVKENRKDKMPQVGASSMETTVSLDGQSSEYFDYWLNKQVRKSPT